jgi:hypothetical protein
MLLQPKRENGMQAMRLRSDSSRDLANYFDPAPVIFQICLNWPFAP